MPRDLFTVWFRPNIMLLTTAFDRLSPFNIGFGSDPGFASSSIDEISEIIVTASRSGASKSAQTMSKSAQSPTQSPPNPCPAMTSAKPLFTLTAQQGTFAKLGGELAGILAVDFVMAG
jgi:hypothetical protein